MAIDEASSRIQAELGYHLALETVLETFRPVNGSVAAGEILLERTPVVTIDSITVDSSALADGDWDFQPRTAGCSGSAPACRRGGGSAARSPSPIPADG